MTKTWLAILAALAAFGAGAQPAPAALRVMGFGGSSNWPIFAAQEERFFEREGVAVDLLQARDSATQLGELARGRIDIAMTAMDNVISHDGEIFAFLGVNSGGRSSLIVAPAIQSYADLKGRPLAVDAPDSGYAFVLIEMLARAGVAPGSYSLLSVGGSRQRLEALETGKAAGALLNAPADATAEAAGMRRLGSSSDVLLRYQASVGAARRSWAKANAETLVRYIRGFVAAMDWLYDPANRDAALKMLERRLRVSAKSAQRSYEEALDPQHGSFARRAAIDVDGVQAVLELRRRHGPSRQALGEAARYYDLSYYRKAIAP